MPNEKNMYAIFHSYETDGGFGDAVDIEDLLFFTMATQEEVCAFCAEHDKWYVYSKPYAELHKGGITYRKVSFHNLSEVDMKDYQERIDDAW